MAGTMKISWNRFISMQLHFDINFAEKAIILLTSLEKSYEKCTGEWE